LSPDTPSPTRTSATLLGRLKHDVNDQASWAEFVRRYGPLIHQWCRRWKLQPADAEDVTQVVLVKLAGRLRTFEYDRTQRFRAFVKTLAHHAWCDFLDARRRSGALGSGDTAMFDQLDTVEARDDLQARLADAFDRELAEEAMARIRLRVEPRTWEAFRLTALEGLSGAEAADRVGMEVPTVFKAKSKVQKMLKDEIRKIEETW
jgi:RNA polymerase sigma-70 factor (ECF subfamily)